MAKERKNSEWLLVTAVSLGGFLEWYEIGLYIYWPLIILSKLVNYEMPAAEALNTALVIATGFCARPLGGLIFGRWGDRKGRKVPFIYSIAIVALPSLLVAFLPSYLVWSAFSTILFTAVKFFQGIPAGGELPGTICFLAENGLPNRRKYLCSFTFVGPQLGLLFSMSVCLLLQSLFSQEALIATWWRLIFLTSGLIGLIGFFLRKRLHESFEFENLIEHKNNLKHPVYALFKTHADKVILGICLSIFQVVTFCVLTILPSVLYKNMFHLSISQNLGINAISLLVCAIAPPCIGKFSTFFKNAPFFWISAIGILLFSYPFYLAIMGGNLVHALLIHSIMILLYSIQAALLPSLLADLFPTSMRYTGIGFSFNVCDGVLWGLVPILTATLIQTTGNSAAFIIFLPLSAVIFILSYIWLKNRFSHRHF